jgi:chromosome segregation ATPase
MRPPPATGERDLGAARAALRDQEQALAQERKRLEQANAEIAASREELSLLRARAENLARALEQEEQRRAAIETELEAARNDPELGRLRDQVKTLERSMQEAAAPHEAEVGRLEELLAERGAEILDLRREVDRREQLVREILSQPPVAEAPVAQAPQEDVADLRTRLDRLAAEVARREADLVAASWKISMGERKIAPTPENER